MEVKFFKVKSFTDPDKEYTVRRLADGSWKCDCPHFVFNEKKIGAMGCDHVRKIRHIKTKSHGREKIVRCETCKGKLKNGEAKVIKKYGFKECIKCREKKQQRR